MKKNWEGFATTLCEVLKYDFEEAIKKNKDDKTSEFDVGYLSALHHLYTLIEEKADQYEIPMQELSLDMLKEQDFFF